MPASPRHGLMAGRQGCCPLGVGVGILLRPSGYAGQVGIGVEEFQTMKIMKKRRALVVLVIVIVILISITSTITITITKCLR